MWFLYLWERPGCDTKGLCLYDEKDVLDFKNSPQEYIADDNEFLTSDDIEFKKICTRFEFENDKLAIKIYSELRHDIIGMLRDTSC